MNFKKLTFSNHAGQKLSGRLDLPETGSPHTYALFAHCFTCSKNLKAMAHISRALTGAGIAVLRFDFTGLGESEGDFVDTNFSSNVSDLIDAATFLARHHQAPGILIGHSLGGAAVLQAAGSIASVAAVATIAAPAEPAHLQYHFDDVRDALEKNGQVAVDLAGRRFNISQQFIDDLAQNKMKAFIRNLNRALLVLHSPLDKVVDIDNAAQIFTAAKHPKSFVSLGRADHLLSDNADAHYAGALIAVWAQKYLRFTWQGNKRLGVLPETGS